jgi:hypothetical protein
MPDPDDALFADGARVVVVSAYAPRRDSRIVGAAGEIQETAFTDDCWCHRVLLDDPTKAVYADTDASPVDPGDPDYGKVWITGPELNDEPEPA